MNDITFKVTPKGEGKTKWLLEISKRYADEKRPIFLFTDEDKDYIKFCEKYFNMFKEICPVVRLTAFKLTPDAVVLVDDLFSHSNSIGDFSFMHRNCYKMFITVEGTTSYEENKKTWNDLYEQITIDTMGVLNA